MHIPLQIRFRNIEASDAVEEAVRKRAEQLERIDSAITSCRVTIELAHRHQQRATCSTS